MSAASSCEPRCERRPGTSPRGKGEAPGVYDTVHPGSREAVLKLSEIAVDNPIRLLIPNMVIHIAVGGS